MVKGQIKRDTLPCIYDKAQVLAIRIKVDHVDRNAAVVGADAGGTAMGRPQGSRRS